jgi:hypothetical protein
MEKISKAKISSMCKSMVRLTLFLVATIHFWIIAIYLMPDNPIKHQHNYSIQKYINPFFTQTWNLFSPNPVNSNITILLQFKTVTSIKADTTQWVDIIEPIINERSQSFWSPSQRILKNMSTITQSISEVQRDLKDYVQKQDTIKNKEITFNKMYSKVFPESSGHKVLMSYSIYVFNRMFPNQRFDNVSVRYRIIYEDFPRFSKRKLDYYDKKNSKYSEMKSIFCKLL